MKSPYFAKLFKEKKEVGQSMENDTLVLDFGGLVQYEAFRQIIDFVYLDDLNILDFVNDSTEMIEIIKLAKQYKLDSLFKACESHFKELMVQTFDCTNFIQVKSSGI